MVIAVPLYEVELQRRGSAGEDAGDVAEVRITDRALRPGSVLTIGSRHWLVESFVPASDDAAAGRFRCREVPDPEAEGGVATTRVAVQTNRTIRELGDDEPGGLTWEFFCECGCFTLVPMTLADFDRSDGVWAPGHRPVRPRS